jgi:hypothetical protein
MPTHRLALHNLNQRSFQIHVALLMVAVLQKPISDAWV